MNFDNRSRRDDFTFSIHDTAMNENNFISTSHGFFIVFLVVFQVKTVGISIHTLTLNVNSNY